MVFAAGLAAALLTAPQAGAAEILEGVTVATATSILQEWGATEITEGESTQMKINEQITLTVKRLAFKRSNVVMVAQLYCNNADPTGNCVGVKVTCAFEDSGTPLATLNSYNMGYRAGKAFQASNQAPKVYVSERYMILDNGVARANILTQLNVFLYATGALLEHIKTSGTVASAPVPAGGQMRPLAFIPHAAVGAVVHSAAASEADPLVVNHVK
jgi:hypothetical protein